MTLDAEALGRADYSLADLLRGIQGGEALAKPIIPPMGPTGTAMPPVFPAIRTGPEKLFDYSRLNQVPNVPQSNLPRYVPERGVPADTQAVASPKNVSRINSLVQRGLDMGAGGWYNTEQLLHHFVNELGPTMGPKAYSRFIDYVAATSPRSKVPQNARAASYFYHADTQGIPLPQVVMGKQSPKLVSPLPNPYGSIAQALHVQNANNIVANNGWLGNVFQNPKPASFAENLRGNWTPVTIDTHNMRLLGLNRDMPRGNEYGFLERLQQEQAAKMGISPAQYQAGGWVGAGSETGLKSPPDPFLKVLEDRIGITADKMGMSKSNVLRRMIRGEIPLSSIAPIDMPVG